MLTHTAVRAARPMPRAYKRADGAGLYLHVAPTGTKSWRMRYRDANRLEQTLTFGLWPEVSIDDARARRDQARARLAEGGDPRTRAATPNLNFAGAARAWHAHRAGGWSPVHAADVLLSLERDVLPVVGHKQLDTITRPMILALLEAVEVRGARETARRLLQRLQAVFEFARAKGWSTAENPANVREALRHGSAAARQPALVDVDELVALRVAVEQLDAAPILKLAARFLALTAVRLGSLRGMRWSEVEDLDAREPLWRVPAARMKLGRAQKNDAAHDHLVPLSTPAAAVLRAARSIAGLVDADALVFPGRRGSDALIGTGAIGALYARAGYAGRHVPHGWRASFSTIMNERRPAEHVAIDKALGHKPTGMTKVEAAYNRAQHLQRRRELLEEWAALLLPCKHGLEQIDIEVSV